jgi:hypothetical protein
MRRVAILLFVCLSAVTFSFGQLGITLDNTAPNSSAMLDVKSTTKGLLPPRMTFSQRNAIVNPASGLIVICTNCKEDGTETMSIFAGNQWQDMVGNCDLPVSPAEGVHVHTNTQIIWNWNTVPIATGYKWSVTNDYTTATNMGTATSKTETGLTPGILYMRYIWAYNACGNSEPTVITGPAVDCGNSFTTTHTAGTVAPVTKTVTYGTVTNIPGETAKCWITRNLGASQQATAVDDDTEASAGWYWQFNRMQGYKHDGTTLTPAWTITRIIEDSDWEPINDPCSLLLGSAWRIPTRTEWTNVDAAGNWSNWNGPFSSGLQMHGAGYLNYFDGSLSFRGSNGSYWSGTQNIDAYVWCLSFTNGYSTMSNGIYKAYGFSARCVRD